MSKNNEMYKEDEIDLKELFISIWAYKWVIGIVTAISVFLAINYISIAQKYYTANSVFMMDFGEDFGISLGGELGGLSALAGVPSLGNSDAEKIIERVKHRIFIEKLNNTVKLSEDGFFNTYDPNAVDPLWKSTLKNIIGWKSSDRDANESQWQGILSVYQENVKVSVTENGAISVKATHQIPERSAIIANAIMEQIIAMNDKENDVSQDERLDYLTTILSNSLQDVDDVQSKLKQFTLENNALPLESFKSASIALDALRTQSEKVQEFIVAVNALQSVVENGPVTDESYNALSNSHPIINQIEFRRVLGISEVISAWRWPSVETIDAVKNTLFDRRTQLDAELLNLEEETAKFADDAKEYARLERKRINAEANYTVLLEQVKAQSVAAGYRPERAKIYEYAFTPIRASSPNTLLILTLSIVLSMIAAMAISLILSMRRGVYFSLSTMLQSMNASFSSSLKKMQAIKNKNFSDIDTYLQKRTNTGLLNLVSEVSNSNKNTIIITGSKTKIKPSTIARALAVCMQGTTSKIGLIDFSLKQTNLPLQEDTDVTVYSNFNVLEQYENITMLTPEGVKKPISFLSTRQALSNIEQLGEHFDYLILSGDDDDDDDDDDGISLLRRLRKASPYHISLARVKSTKKQKLETLHSLLPIESLFYE